MSGQAPYGGITGAPPYEDILYEVEGGRATITINRPERLNAFRGLTMLELCDAFERAADDEAVGVIVFTGAGERAFCVGGDVREPTRTMKEKRAGNIIGPRLAGAMRNNGKPIICRVRGYCIGGGNELNIVSDLTITDTTGVFGQAGPKIGSAPLWWGCQLMPAITGEKKAREILFLTRQYDAHEALAMGLVNAVVEPAELDAEVDRWCEQILRRSPQGLRLAKIAMNTATDALYSSTNHGMELMALNHVYGVEPAEGIASFQEKRPADWRRFREGQGPEPEAGR
ncbi:MAG: enoyl-CoA hydratase/isomerase family protein [Thermoleophilia bacterium]|jgi:naphthoate synthase/2-ketocyclohexanecarboxyl-CoA hydrolase|nr:enoyl-CoA hydratase/isomerase family protein [Thermoleophilia bacterium]